VAEFAEVGLLLNASKTVALTTQAQPPEHLSTGSGKINVVMFHKWLGCIVDVGARDHVLSHHLQAASKAFHANKAILCDHNVTLRLRLNFFEKVITPAACFAAGRRTVYQNDLHQIDVLCRKLLRRVVGPPGDVDWSKPWHEVLHAWHEKLNQILEENDVMLWSHNVLSQYWKLGAYLANLPSDRWAKRVLQWVPYGTRAKGRPREQWESKLRKFCKAHDIGDWWVAARDPQAWISLQDDFIYFMRA